MNNAKPDRTITLDFWSSPSGPLYVRYGDGPWARVHATASPTVAAKAILRAMGDSLGVNNPQAKRLWR